MTVIDSHAHLDLTMEAALCNLSELLPQNLERALHISLSPMEFFKNQGEFSQFGQIAFATGCYPDCTTRPDYSYGAYMGALRRALLCHKHAALGEAGIDFKYEKYGPRDRQVELFEGQIALAEELGLPLIVHSRETFAECFDCLKGAPGVRCVFHCFSYGPAEAEKLLEAGHYLSFTGNLTYKSAQNIRDAAAMAPLDRILFETDCPYLAPLPFRGQANTPAWVEHTYRYFAQMKALDEDLLAAQIRENFYRLFPGAL